MRRIRVALADGSFEALRDDVAERSQRATTRPISQR
jgi:hypothetical protein